MPGRPGIGPDGAATRRWCRSSARSPAVPLSFCQRMSDLPSPLKSAAATTCHVVQHWDRTAVAAPRLAGASSRRKPEPRPSPLSSKAREVEPGRSAPKDGDAGKVAGESRRDADNANRKTPRPRPWRPRSRRASARPPAPPPGANQRRPSITVIEALSGTLVSAPGRRVGHRDAAVEVHGDDVFAAAPLVDRGVQGENVDAVEARSRRKLWCRWRV